MSILRPINEKICALCSNPSLTNFIKITGAIGQVLSSFAFIGSVVTNDELPPKQKAFLTAQEAIEGVINVSLFCLFTSKARDLSARAISNKTNIFFPSSTKKMFRGKRLFRENQDVIIKITSQQEFQQFKNTFPTFAGFAGSVIATAIISPIIKNITSAIFLKVKDVKDKKNAIITQKINAASLRKRVLPIDKYIETVNSPKGMKL